MTDGTETTEVKDEKTTETPVPETKGTPERRPGLLDCVIRLDALKEFLNLIKAVTNAVRLEFTRNGVKVVVMDESHVAMLRLELDASEFGWCDLEREPLVVGLDTRKLSKMLTVRNADELVEIRYAEPKGVGRITVKNGVVEHTFDTVDTMMLAVPKQPSLNGKNRLSTGMKAVRRAVLAAAKVNDNLTMVLSSDPRCEVTISAEDETEKVRSVILAAKEPLSGDREDTYSKYPVDFLSAILRASTTAQEVTLTGGKDYPLKAEFIFSKHHGEGGKAVFMLAPRVEDR